MGRYVLAAAGMLSAAALVSVVATHPAVAQAVEAALMRDADNPARQPFQAASQGRIFTEGYEPSVIAKVPGGKRLVIEYASAWITDWSSYSTSSR